MSRRERQHYTLVCKHRHCQKIIYMTRNQNVPRPVRYGECNICKPQRWGYRNAPMGPR